MVGYFCLSLRVMCFFFTGVYGSFCLAVSLWCLNIFVESRVYFCLCFNSCVSIYVLWSVTFVYLSVFLCFFYLCLWVFLLGCVLCLCLYLGLCLCLNIFVESTKYFFVCILIPVSLYLCLMVGYLSLSLHLYVFRYICTFTLVCV